MGFLLEHLGLVLHEAEQNGYESEQRACRSTEAGSGSALGKAYPGEYHAEAYAYAYPEHLLHHLRKRGGSHGLLPLEEASVAAHYRAEHESGSCSPEGHYCLRLLLDPGYYRREYEKYDARGKPQSQHHLKGYLEYPVCLVVLPHGAPLGYHPGDGGRKSGGRYGEHQNVDGVCHAVYPHAFRAYYVGQRHPEEYPQHLYDYPGQPQKSRAGYECFFRPVVFCHQMILLIPVLSDPPCTRQAAASGSRCRSP